jgi:hypothetical protein
MFTVRVDEPDPRFGNMLLEQFGGANGELAAAMKVCATGAGSAGGSLTPIRQPCAGRCAHIWILMELNLIQDFAIQARVASVIGANVFDRIFAGVKFAETDGPLLYVYSRDEESAAEIEDDFSLLIADIASGILKREVELVVVLPNVLQ